VSLGHNDDDASDEAAGAMSRRCVSKLSVNVRATPPGRNPDAPAEDPYLDITRLTRDTGFEPAFDVDAGVTDYVAWLREHPS